jgi:glycerol-3-phosphate acyltransferase PlsY
MNYIIVIIIFYMIGQVSPSMIVARKVKKIDIRDVNSKNAGTSNIAITMGMKYGVMVGVLDILKGLIPVLILRFIFPDNEIIWFAGGLSVVMGHAYPFLLGFRGGKGTATFGGMCFAIFPLASLVLTIVFFAVLILSDYMALATMFAIIVIPIGMYFFDYNIVSVALVSLYSLLSFYLHFPNLVRIFKGNELGLKEGIKR